MKKQFLLVCMALLNLLSATAQLPTTSTAGADVWYYIRCTPRNSAVPNAKWLTGATDQGNLTVKEFTSGDEQRWKVITSGDGLALVNKAYGTYMNSDSPYTTPIYTQILACSTAPTNSLQFVPSALVPNGVYIANKSATVTAGLLDLPSLNFLFYAAGSGSAYNPITYPVVNSGVNCTVVFRTDKDLLTDIITIGTTLLNSTSVGPNPGQYTVESIEALQGAIEYAQVVADNPNSTIKEFADAGSNLNMIIDLTNSFTIMPSVSSDLTENWYYIQGNRPESAYITSTGVDAALKQKVFANDDTQLWKLVQNGTGYAFVNKATGQYMNTDVAHTKAVLTQATPPAIALRIIKSPFSTNNTARFYIENVVTTPPALTFRLYVGSASDLKNSTTDLTNNVTFLFLSYDEVFRTEFVTTLAKAQKIYDGTIAGVEFGQYPSDLRSSFYDAIAVAKALVPADMSVEELKAATLKLNEDIKAYKCYTDIKQFEPLFVYKWFRLVNKATAVYANGKAMSSNGRTEGAKFTFETKDENSDAQLFRFALNDSKTNVLNIINKATGLYMGSDGKMVPSTTTSIEFALKQLDPISFTIKPTGLATLHAAESGKEILNYNDGIGSASAWGIEYVKQEDIVDLSALYLKYITNTRAKYNAIDPLLVGKEIGQFSATALATFNATIATEEAKDAALMTADELKAGIIRLNDASNASLYNTDVKLLISENPATTYKWFRIINDAAATVAYATGMAMSSQDRLVNEKFTFETKNEASETQLFRFELNTAQTNVLNIINKANGLYVGADGKMMTASTVGNEFSITQLAGGSSFWIDPTNTVSADPNDEYNSTAPLHAAQSGLNILNYVAGVGSASAWKFEYVMESPSAVKPVSAFTYRVRTLNNIITVDGVDNFEVYSVLGQKQNIKNELKSGVYFVKANNATQKVVLK